MRKFKIGGQDLLEGGGGSFAENADGTAIIPVDTQDSWIVGSDRMDRDTADTTKDARAFFNKAKGAFRSGKVTGEEWNDAKVGNYSHAEGHGATASGGQAHAEGTNTVASGPSSHAEGSTTKATTDQAHAEGFASTASGTSSHAEGNSTASGYYSHSEGQGTIASGQRSHAEGLYSEASRHAQHAKAGGSFSSTGDAQIGNLVLRNVSTDATPALLVSGLNTSLSYSGLWTLDTNRAHKVCIEAIARRTDVAGEVAGFTWEGVVARDTGFPRIVGAPIEAGWSDDAAAAWTLTVGINTASISDMYLEILGTGEAGKTIRWVAGLYVTEVG